MADTVAPQNAPAVVALDVGTTTAKAAAFTTAARAVGAAEVGYPLCEPEPGWEVQDPVAVLDAALAAGRRAVAAAQAAGLRIAGLSCSTALHALTALDDHDRPLTPMLTWADTRAVAQAARLRAEHPRLHARTGTPLQPMSPLAKLVWFREHDAETWRAAARWVGLKALLLHRLTGRWVVDHSVATATGLLDLDTLDWDPEALEIAGVDADRLPELVPVDARLALTAQAAAALGLDAATPVVAGAGDGPLANLGVGAIGPGVAACSIGTSAALRVVTEQPAIDPAGRLFSYALTPGRWAVGGALNNGGIVAEWAAEALAPELLRSGGLEAVLAVAEQAPPGCDGLAMLPHLLGERTSRTGAPGHGAYLGLTRAHTRPHLVRAALEGVCQQLAVLRDAVRVAGHTVDEVRATGGFARSPLWRRILCDALGSEVHFPAVEGGSALGAALLAFDALDLVDGIEAAAQLVDRGPAVAPEPEAAAALAAARPALAAVEPALAALDAGSL